MSLIGVVYDVALFDWLALNTVRCVFIGSLRMDTKQVLSSRQNCMRGWGVWVQDAHLPC